VCKEDEKDMATAANDIKSKLLDLKKRAKSRAENPHLRHLSSEEEKIIMKEYTKDIYKAQMDTIRNTD
jgi:hypothetical protein